MASIADTKTSISLADLMEAGNNINRILQRDQTDYRSFRDAFIGRPVTPDRSFSDEISWIPAQQFGMHIPDKPSTDMLKHMAMPETAEGDGRAALAIEVEDLLGYTPLRKDAGAPSRLQRLLVELEIEAFDESTVRSYKEKMRRHFQAKANDTRQSSRLSPGMWSVSYVTEVVWRRVELSGYTKPVPEFVLRKAIEIKRAAPDAMFFVDELVQEQKTLDPFLYVQLGQDVAAIEVWDEPEFEKTL